MHYPLMSMYSSLSRSFVCLLTFLTLTLLPSKGYAQSAASTSPADIDVAPAETAALPGEFDEDYPLSDLLLSEEDLAPESFSFSDEDSFSDEEDLDFSAEDDLDGLNASFGDDLDAATDGKRKKKKATKKRKVATPKINPGRRTFSGSVKVSFKSSTSGVTFYYTLNGKKPNRSSKRYKRPFTLKKNAKVRVRAYRNGYLPSSFATATFKKKGNGGNGGNGGGGSAPPPAKTPSPVNTNVKAVYLNTRTVNAVKAKIKSGREPWASAYRKLIGDANRALNQRPLSVVDNGGPAGGGRDRHKFGTDHPKAKGANRGDYTAAWKMSNAIRDLGMAYAFTGDDRYANKAVDLLYHWAVNSSTRMTPSTYNSSPHRAGSSGRKQNSIELYITLPKMVYGASLVAGHRRWSQKGSNAEGAFQGWVRSFLSHADRSYGGFAQNNIYAWWVATRATAAAYVGDTGKLNRAFSDWKRNAIKQIDRQGRMSEEVKRTDHLGSLGYSLYALTALTMTAEVARLRGVDLYGYQDGKGGAALKRAFDYHAKYVINPNSWPGRKKTTNTKDDAATYEMAYSRWKDRKFRDVVTRKGRPLKEEWAAGVTTLSHGELFSLTNNNVEGADPELSATSELATGAVPTEFKLETNYPNPFNPTTTITYHLPEAAHVSLSVYNVAGQRVAELVSGQQSEGIHQAVWDGRDAAGVSVASGLYLYRIEAGTFRQTRKMTLLK